MDDVPDSVDSEDGPISRVLRPIGTSDGVIEIAFRRGKWEVQEPLEMVVPHVPPPPAFKTTIDPSKRRDKGQKRNYTSHRLFEAY